MFNAPAQAALHVELLKGADGEIALKLGDNQPFGVINVGDPSRLAKLCEEQQSLVVTDREFADSLFRGLDKPDTTINLLIGSKKFTEGWNSWRVSTMGLMNVGKGEGSEIIQLFGRGVRLKGYGFGLKRSRHVPDVLQHPPHIETLETLNIFGIRASYMQQFKEYLSDEGLPDNEERVECVLPVIKNLGTLRLYTLHVRPGIDFKRDGQKPMLGPPPDHLLGSPVTVDWYPKIQAEQSQGLQSAADVAERHEGRLTSQHIAFLDLDAIYFELQRFKNERSWYNLNLSRQAIQQLLEKPNWYRLLIPKEELAFTDFSRVRLWQEIAVTLLKKYIDRYYKYRKNEYELPHLEYRTLSEDDGNFFNEYRFLIDQSQEQIINELCRLKQEIEQGRLRDIELGNFQAIAFGQHLYEPLIYLDSKLISVQPVALNEGERDFVVDLRSFYEHNKSFFSGRQLYLLRNRSRGRGIGFFEAGNFHPDFILWLLDGTRQHITFVDPKGVRNLLGADDPKIRFYKTVKELEQRLGDPEIVLNSFIVANTPHQKVAHWRDETGELMDRARFEQRHVLFQNDDKALYIGKLLSRVIDPKQ